MVKFVCNLAMVFLVLLLVGCNESTQSLTAVTTGVASQGVPDAVTPCEYSLVSAGQGEELKGPEGKVYKVIHGAADGFLDSLLIEGDKVRVAGWAAEVGAKNRPVVGVVVFVGGKCVGFASTTIERPDVAEHFRKTALKQTGFDFKLPLVVFKNSRFEGFRIMALTEAGAAGVIDIGNANKGANEKVWGSDTSK